MVEAVGVRRQQKIKTRVEDERDFVGFIWRLLKITGEDSLKSMSIAELRKLPKAEKLRIVEALWSDLVESEEDFASPPWHGEALRETEESYARGEIKPLDWDEAKKELRKRFE